MFAHKRQQYVSEFLQKKFSSNILADNMTLGLKGSCIWSELLDRRGEGDGGEGGGELDVGADRNGAHTEHAGVLRQLVVRLIQRQTGLN